MVLKSWTQRDPTDIVARLWQEADGDAAMLSQLALSGEDPVLPSSFRIGAVAQSSIAAAALAAANLYQLKGGPAQNVACDQRAAAIAFRSERYLRVDNRPPPRLWDEIAGLYLSDDAQWLRLHTNFPHHRAGIIKLLGCEDHRDAVAEAVKRWQADEFESAAADAGLVVTKLRSPQEWDSHDQGQAVANMPLFEIVQIGDAPPEPLPPGDQPLTGVRVLDLTRIIAGPVCGRALAGHGADVMLVSAPHLPSVAPLVIDSGRGKLSAHIDLNNEIGQRQLRRLTRQTDIFVEGYRPGGLAQRGFGPEELAALRPGLVYVSLSAYGHQGPWQNRRGFDSLVQHTNGIDAMEAAAVGSDEPVALPCQALDHASGYLMAFAALMALYRRATIGGSWLVRISLAQTGQWIRQLGQVSNGHDCHDPSADDVADRLEEIESGFGTLTVVKAATEMIQTPIAWPRPSVPLGTHPPAWPARL